MNKKKVAWLLVLGLLTTMLVGCNSEDTDEVAVKENQQLVYAVVTKIQGNELTYMEVDESVVKRSLGSNSKKDDDSTTKKSSDNSKDKMTDGNGSQGTPPGFESDGSQGTPPDMGEEGPQGTSPDMNTDESQGSSNDNDSEEIKGSKTDLNQGKSKTVQIPVGVTVHTTEDMQTSFSRIQSGDMLKILYEKDENSDEVIVEIWMIQ